jgi:molybdate transport system substrate-binding protein
MKAPAGMRKFLGVGFIIGLAVGALIVVDAFQFLSSSASRIVVFAGAASAPVLEEAAHAFEVKDSVKVELRLGGSGSVLSAMKISRTGDIFLPGSPDFLLQAVKQGVVNLTTGHVEVFAYLVPAIIVQKGNPKNITSLEDLARPGIRVGIADPESVCVGLYARDLLQKNGLWETVSKNIVVYAQSCDATAALIPERAVDAIIGWHVFHAWTPDKADIVWITASRIPKISYIAGAVSVFAENRALAESFLDFLASDDGRAIWAKYGYFGTLEDAKAHAPEATVELLVTNT